MRRYHKSPRNRNILEFPLINKNRNTSAKDFFSNAKDKRWERITLPNTSLTLKEAFDITIKGYRNPGGFNNNPNPIFKFAIGSKSLKYKYQEHPMKRIKSLFVMSTFITMLPPWYFLWSKLMALEVKPIQSLIHLSFRKP